MRIVSITHSCIQTFLTLVLSLSAIPPFYAYNCNLRRAYMWWTRGTHLVETRREPSEGCIEPDLDVIQCN